MKKRAMRLPIHLLYAVLLCGLAACGGGSPSYTSGQDNSSASSWTWSLPDYFSMPDIPVDNPMTEAKFQLGRALFYDTRLSSNGIQSCSSCHRQEKAFTDGLATSRGATGEFTSRSAQTLGNAAWHTTYTWQRLDLLTLERQMEVPLFADHPIEMGLTPQNQDAMLARLSADPTLLSLFTSAFPDDSAPVSMSNVIKAIAVFERGLISADSKYDRTLQGKATLTAEELHGKDLFFSDQAKCFRCHGSFNFDDQSNIAGSTSTAFQNTGLYNIDGLGGYPAPNRGIFETTAVPSDMGRFRVASLRNIALTAPYMHDGSIATLEDVVDFYVAGGRLIASGTNAGDGRFNPYKNPLVGGISLNDQEKADLIAFLRTLTDEAFVTNPRFGNPTLSSTQK